jgi:CheY-like chemotaxis protein
MQFPFTRVNYFGSRQRQSAPGLQALPVQKTGPSTYFTRVSVAAFLALRIEIEPRRPVLAPLVQAGKAMQELQSAQSIANGSRRQRLLVGEKSPTIRDFLLSVFTAEGYEVVGVANGSDLLDAVAVSLHPEFGSGEFDLVISESCVLGATELQAFGNRRNRVKVPPFVFIASSGDKELHAKAQAFDAVAVLEKPIEMANLRDLVNSFLHHPTGEHTGALADTHG